MYSFFIASRKQNPCVGNCGGIFTAQCLIVGTWGCLRSGSLRFGNGACLFIRWCLIILFGLYHALYCAHWRFTMFEKFK